jgi:hypothetical protein
VRPEFEIRQELAHAEGVVRRLRKQLRKGKREKLGLGPKRKGIGCRDRDEELKAKRGYTNPSTFVRRDGSEKLVGEDWDKRVEEIRERSGGRCEREYATPDNPRVKIRCCMEARDPHHKIKRSIRRDDRASNLEALCPIHHDEEDGRKVRSDKAERRFE